MEELRRLQETDKSVWRKLNEAKVYQSVENLYTFALVKNR
jgi:hypothetical protein